MPIQPADLILYEATPRDALITRMVGATQLLLGAGSRPITYSHVAIAAYEDGWQYESKWPRSGHFPVDQGRSYEVWRLKGSDAGRRAAILLDCMRHSGELYPLDTLATFGLITHRHAMVCSQWAAARCLAGGYGFEREGFPIVAPDVMLDAGILDFVCDGGRP